MRRAARTVTTVALTALLVWFVWQRRDDLRPVWDDPSWDLLLIGVLIAASHFLNSLEFWVVYRAMGVGITWVENWMVFTAGLLGNLLPGQVGTLYKFRYMGAVHGMPYSRNGSSYGANLVISLGSSSVVGVLGVVLYSLVGGRFAWGVLAAFVGLGAACIVVMNVSIPVHKVLPGRLARAGRTFADGWDEIRRTPRTSITVAAIDVTKYAITAWRFFLAFRLLGVHESYWFFLVIAPAAAIAGIIAFTPGGLGFRELFVTAAAVGMGSGFDTGLLAATTDRGVMLISALVLGVSGYAYTAPRLRRARTTQPTPNEPLANGR